MDEKENVMLRTEADVARLYQALGVVVQEPGQAPTAAIPVRTTSSRGTTVRVSNQSVALTSSKTLGASFRLTGLSNKSEALHTEA